MSTPNASAPPADPRPTVPASELRAALQANTPLAGRFSGSIIEGDLDLDALAYAHKLVLRDSVFRGRFAGSETRFARTVDLSGCTFEQGLTLEGSRIGGELVLEGVTVRQGEVTDYAANLAQI